MAQTSDWGRALIDCLSKNPDRQPPDCSQVLALQAQGQADLTKALVQMGNTYLKLGNADQALRQFDAAIRQDSRRADAYRGRSAAYEALGQHDRAAADRERADAIERALLAR